MTPKLQRTTINRQIDFCHWAAPAYLFAAANPCEAFQPGSEMGETGRKTGSRPDVRDAKEKIRNSSPAPSQWLPKELDKGQKAPTSQARSSTSFAFCQGWATHGFHYLQRSSRRMIGP